MTARPSIGRWSDLGLVRTAVAFTLLAGLIAVALPFLNALVVALATIALAGATRTGATGRADVPLRHRVLRWAAGAAVVVGAVLFVVLPTPWSVGRGLFLAASLVPLAAIDRWTGPGIPAGWPWP